MKQRKDDGDRGDLTDEQWSKLKPLLPLQKAHIGQPAHDHRRILRSDEENSTEGCTLERNRVERLINRLKQCRRRATRYKKYAVNYLAMFMIGAIRLWL